MKKSFILLCIIFCGQMAMAEDCKSLFKEFKKKSEAEYVHLGKLPLKIFKIGQKETKQFKMLKKITGLRVLSLDDCRDSVKQNFMQRVHNLSQDGYEEILRSTDEGDKVSIMIKTNKNAVRELLVINTEQDGDCNAVLFNGKISQKAIDSLLHEYKP